jgi:ubiquinone/menaquinone biosynthesis C-methylase UbiE
MKLLENVEYYHISEVIELLHNHFTEEQILENLESGFLKGKQIDGHWYASQNDIDEFYEKTVLKDVHLTEKHNIDLRSINITGRTLDIGGGGEGTIGQLAPKYVVAIDPNERELIEAKGDFLKIVMDAKDLKFLPETFDIVTSFFTLMYIPLSEHARVFNQIYRVLKTGGVFLLWDIEIPEKYEKNKIVYAINLDIDIGNKIISTGFGTKWDKIVNIDHYLQLAKNVGFEIVSKEINGETFFTRFKKI